MESTWHSVLLLNIAAIIHSYWQLLTQSMCTVITRAWSTVLPKQPLSHILGMQYLMTTPSLQSYSTTGQPTSTYYHFFPSCQGSPGYKIWPTVDIGRKTQHCLWCTSFQFHAPSNHPHQTIPWSWLLTPICKSVHTLSSATCKGTSELALPTHPTTIIYKKNSHGQQTPKTQSTG